MNCMDTSNIIGGFLQEKPDIIEDPIRDFTVGTRIRIPSKASIDDMK